MTRTRWAYELLMAALAVTAICVALLPDSEVTHRVSLAIWIVFAIDYFVNLVRAPAKGHYVRHNVAELIAILPWDFLRPLRLFRLLRLMRVARGVGVLWRVHDVIQGVLETNGLGYVLVVTTVVIIIGGIVGHEVEPGIHTIGDGIWWSLVTTSTVGYGDIAPKTTAGRVTAAVLMLVGIGTLGMITAGMATYFLKPRHHVDPHIRHVQHQLERWKDLKPHERRALIRMLEELSTGESGD